MTRNQTDNAVDKEFPSSSLPIRSQVMSQSKTTQIGSFEPDLFNSDNTMPRTTESFTTTVTSRSKAEPLTSPADLTDQGDILQDDEQPSQRGAEISDGSPTTKILDWVRESEPWLSVNFEDNDLFKSRSANQRLVDARNSSAIQALFDVFWLKGDLCILVGGPGVGKSLLAIQIADSISKGVPIEGFLNETSAQPVLFFDFELSDGSFRRRYLNSATRKEYQFHENLKILTLNYTKPSPMESKMAKTIKFEDLVFSKIESELLLTEAKVLIIDNLTWIKDNLQDAKEAMPLIKRIHELKHKYSLSILVLAHPPKLPRYRELKLTDIAGSASLGNYIDGAFGIGLSQVDPKLRYLKQLKCRNDDMKYDVGNICLFEVAKEEDFLGMRFINFDSERNHIKEPQDRPSKIKQVKELRKQGHSMVFIANECKMSRNTVREYLKEDDVLNNSPTGK